ncbi:MAG: serine/threonine protein kinase [Bacteroidetes bacterium]|nr:MAG: serine/threonine protein kinase [Bacteroidota bacterium]
MIGEQVLNYRILSALGEGGMGSVYLAQHIQLGRQAAIKALHPNLVNNPQIRERFKNEAATMAHLQHNNIVGLYDYLEATNGLFLIMEFVQGKPLDAYIQTVSGPIPEERVVEFFMQILDGFEYAHNQGVVHRDIKPANFVITPNNEVKILDFGIAKLLAGSSKSLTKTGARMGTVLYMSPEQVKGLEADRRSDIYALGVTLFQMLTGRCPYNEETATEYEVYHQIVNSPLPRAKTFYPTVSDRMQKIIDKATAKNPDDRFQTCAEFKRAMMGQAFNNLAQTMPNPMVKTVTGKPVQQEADDDVYVPLTRPKTGRRRYGWVFFVLWTLLVLGLGATVAFNPFNLRFLKPYAIYHLPIIPDEEAKTLKGKVKMYYEAVESRNFDSIQPFFAPVVDYFSFKKVRPKPDIIASYKNTWQNFDAEKHDIYWDTFAYEHESDSTYKVTLKLKYGSKPKGKKAFNYIDTLPATLRFNQHYQIYYINKE